MSLSVKTIINNPVSSNCHIIYDGSEKRTIVVDPGTEDSIEISGFLSMNALHVDYVLLTHEHFDHTWAADKFCCPVLCTKECADALDDKKLNLSLYFNNVGFTVKVETTCVEELGMKLTWLKHDIEFYKNQAHSPGGLLCTLDKYLITGDSLIKDLKTVTKLQWANKTDLPFCEQWLREKQGQGYTVLAGHGDSFELDDYDLNKIF